MIPFVVATPLTTYSPVYLVNEDRIMENVRKEISFERAFKKKEKEKERDSELYKNIPNEPRELFLI